MFEIAFPIPPMGCPSSARSAISASIFDSSVSRNSTLCRLVNRRWPSQYFSASSANLRIRFVPSSRGEPARTVNSLSPDSPTWTITPGLRISWYFHFP